MLRLMTLAVALAGAQGFLLAPRVPRAHVGRSSSPVMGYEEAAMECLEEGCSVDTVESLLAELKATNQPDAKLVKTINQLETLLKEPDANKSEIEKIVSAAARSFQVVDGFVFKGEPLGYTGKPGTTTLAGKSFDN